MNFKVVSEVKDTKEELRKTHARVLTDLARKNDKVVALEADLSSSMATGSFKKEYEDRFINFGIMEANMMGSAAGLSLSGMIPFVHTFAPFATRRAYDQIFLSIGYSGLTTNIFGSDPGVTAAFNGGTHMPFEDIAIMRAIPEATVIEVSDDVQLENVMHSLIDRKGLNYVRLVRKKARQIYESGSTFDIGKGAKLYNGKDVSIVANGIMVNEALVARDILKSKGIDAAVIDMLTIKPIDKELIIDEINNTGFILTAENHNIIGGLGSAVCEVVSEYGKGKVVRIGVKDRFGQVGDQDFLQKEYNLTAEDIVKEVENGLK